MTREEIEARGRKTAWQYARRHLRRARGYLDAASSVEGSPSGVVDEIAGCLYSLTLAMKEHERASK